nr:PREDICTED: uncharacterized protein LOC109035136 [Bemisia tabaci]
MKAMLIEDCVMSTCATMTEDRSINGDININSKKSTILNSNGPFSPVSNSNIDPDNSASFGGGRLKFFKDGKFILELSHQKDGERTCWVPVAKKTFWPTVGTPRLENCTSFSVSDDNSSIQSSPWQRDHSWKQSNPRRNVSKELQFMVRIRPLPRKYFSSYSVRRKRRRPYDPTKIEVKDDSSHHATSKSVKKEKKEKNGIGAKLSSIVYRLKERIHVSVVKTENTINPARIDPGIVSPRKRILREFEKVSLDEIAVSTKRHRARTAPAPAKPVSSHSITSILAREDEPSFLRSLLGCSGSEASSASFDSSQSRNPYVVNPSPSPESVRPSACSSTTSVTPSPPPPKAGTLVQPQPTHPQFPYAMSMHPPFLPHPQASFYSGLSHYRSSPSYWPLYAMSSLPRNTLYPPMIPAFSPLSPSSWTPLTQPAIGEFKRDDGSSDVPLNLSKNAS